MAYRITLFFSFLLIAFTSQAQNYNITGRILDATDTTTLIGVTVAITSTTDSTIKTGAVTDTAGNFTIEGVNTGRYKLHIEYLGYVSINQIISVTGNNVSIGTLMMKTSTKELKTATIKGHQIRAEQLGDTSQFHADAYKTNPDATAEDLVTKMPGITSDNTGVKVNGETVQQIYVDGKPFFGTDPTLALKNLPSEVIDKIQIFDKLSDQASFTGFDDGNSQKTMNIVTKKNKSEGQFGKVYAGYGTDDRYIAGGNFNSFEGDQRISIIGLTNNINQQNFSSQDILGITGGSGGGSGNRGGAFGGGGGNSGGNSGNNFLTGQQAGITTTNSAGLNYSDQWGKKIKVTGSYFFNNTDNTNNTELSREYTFPKETYTNNPLQPFLYDEQDSSKSQNFNHRANVRFEYDIDSANTLIVTPNLSFQKNYAPSYQNDSSYSPSSLLLANSLNTSNANNNGYTFSNNILLQHKFHKKGRTVSVNVSTSLNQKTGDGYNNTNSGSRDTSLAIYNFSTLDQRYTLSNNSYTVSSNISYTEPLGKKSQLMFNYTPSYTNSRSDKETDSVAGAPPVAYFDTLLSNKYSSTYTTQKGGMSYRLGDKKMNLMIGANLQYAVLDGNQDFPYSTAISRTFTNVLPNAFFNYRFKDGRNLRITYRTNISPPSITQLQNVVDRSNPLLLSTGNPNLRQDYEQTFLMRYGLTKSKTAHNFFLYGFANYINNYIGNATYTKDSLIPSDLRSQAVRLTAGGQLSRPVNLNYYSNNKLFITYSIPADFIKSNLNFNGGISYTHTPGLVDNVADYSNDYVPSLGVVVSSNVSEKLDFTLAYTGNYNFVQNSLQGQTNNNYYSHVASFKINWIFLKGVVVNTSITHNYYSTFTSSAGNIDYYLWSAYVGYKFFKDRSLEARISAFDILNQNKSISRTVSANYVENDITQVLQQYFMFQLTYTLRHFKGAIPGEDAAPKDNQMPPGGMPPGGFHNHGGGGGGGGFGG